MIKAIFLSHLCLLIVTFFFITSCSGQVNSSLPVEKASAQKPIPDIIGTPPTLDPSHNPYNDTGLVSQYIRTIFQDSRGHYWFGPAGQSVCRYDGKTLEYFSSNTFFKDNSKVDQDTGNSVHATAEDNEGNIWFGTSDGVVKYDGKTFRNYTEKDGLVDTKIGRGSICIDRSGTIWVGTQNGVFRYDPLADKVGDPCFALFDLLPLIHVKDIMEDVDGNLWFASGKQGIFRYDGKAVTNISAKEGLGVNVAGGIAQDKSGNLWFTMKGGICRYDGESFTDFTTEDGLGGSEVWGLLVEESGVIWVSARGSTTRFDPSLPLPEAFTVFTVADGINCCVQSMYQDHFGNMWWGTGQGLYRFDGESFYQVKQIGPW